MLRKKFTGKPEHVVNYLFMVAEEARQIMAELGFRTIDEMVGRVDCLETERRDPALEGRRPRPDADAHAGARSRMPTSRSYCTQKQDHGLDLSLDTRS